MTRRTSEVVRTTRSTATILVATNLGGDAAVLAAEQSHAGVGMRDRVVREVGERGRA